MHPIERYRWIGLALALTALACATAGLIYRDVRWLTPAIITMAAALFCILRMLRLRYLLREGEQPGSHWKN